MAGRPPCFVPPSLLFCILQSGRKSCTVGIVKDEPENPHYTDMTTDNIRICPKCEYERTEKDDEFYSSDECPKCGVIFSKARKPEEPIGGTTNYPEGKTLCSDDSCSGKIGPDDRCSECGKTLEEPSKIERATTRDGQQGNQTAWQIDNRKRSQLAKEEDQQQIDVVIDSICKNCGHEGKPRKIIKGSEGIEIALWLAGVLITVLSVLTGFMILIVPLVYTMWRRTGKKGCPMCNGHMIDRNSPMGKKLTKEPEL